MSKDWINIDQVKHIKPKTKRILFILKNRIYQKEYSQSYGLHNSADMVADYLEKSGNICKVVTVIDGNFIDAEVHKFKPDIVIIEALWVTGKKLEELINIKQYKNIHWVIRVHSNVGFLAVESRAYKYINEYIELNRKNIIISFNNKEFNEIMSSIYSYQFEYLPNIVRNTQLEDNHADHDSEILNIGCFGSPRILKNQLFQATCAILAANKMEKVLHFHINGDIHNPSNPVIHNLKELFIGNPKHKLIIHGWLEHNRFEHLIKKMHLGLQVSFTESFNIVVADFVVNKVPIVVGKTIDWMPNVAFASEVDFDDLTNKIIFVCHNHHGRKLLIELSEHALLKFNQESKKLWNTFLK